MDKRIILKQPKVHETSRLLIEMRHALLLPNEFEHDEGGQFCILTLI